jgi:hypothetical protein
MTHLQDLTNATIKLDEQVTGTQRLWLNNTVIAASSWHVDFDDLISLDDLDFDDDEVRREWLCDCCGGDYPDYSRAAWNVLCAILDSRKDDIVAYMEMDAAERANSTLLVDIETEIHTDVLARIAKIQAAKKS